MATWGPTAISSDADDGHYRSDTTTWTDRTDPGYAAGEYFSVVRDTGGNWWGALRFPNVTVPAGATITSATLRVWIYNPVNVDAANSVLRIYADVGASRTSALGASHHPQSNWTNSTAYAEEVNLVQATPRSITVTSVIQELVDLGGWSSGNAICLSCDPSSGSDTYWSIEITDYDNSYGDGGRSATAQPADLEIVYTAGGVAPLASAYYTRSRYA